LPTVSIEGLNSLLLAVKQKACGYRTVEYKTAMFDFVDGKFVSPCF
jgi:hypothetical protein